MPQGAAAPKTLRINETDRRIPKTRDEAPRHAHCGAAAGDLSGERAACSPKSDRTRAFTHYGSLPLRIKNDIDEWIRAKSKAAERLCKSDGQRDLLVLVAYLKRSSSTLL